MPRLNLAVRARTTRYGLVRVFVAGVFDRQFKITAAEYNALGSRGSPPGVNAGETWTAFGIDLNPGDMQVGADGSLIVRLSETDFGEKDYLRLRPGDYTGTPPSITVTSEKITSRNRADSVEIVSIANGELTWQSR